MKIIKSVISQEALKLREYYKSCKEEKEDESIVKVK